MSISTLPRDDSTLPRDEEEEGLEGARNTDFVLLGKKLVSNSLYVFLFDVYNVFWVFKPKALQMQGKQ